MIVIWGGMALGLLLGRTDAEIGPLRFELSIRPSWDGGTEVRLPPAGTLSFASHDGPFRLQATLVDVDEDSVIGPIAESQAISGSGGHGSRAVVA